MSGRMSAEGVELSINMGKERNSAAISFERLVVL
jgi:hypothetical protein